MRIERHFLRKEAIDGFVPTLTLYLLDKVENGPLRPMVIIFPGGAYINKAENWEGERVAIEYNRAGFNAAVVDYSVSPIHHPQPLLDAMAAIRFVRENAISFGCDPNKTIVLGFSAGGHLAASLSTLWYKYGDGDGIYRPDGTILSYPVITTGEFAHKESIVNLTGKKDEDSEEWRELSLENQVDENTPPTFLWHTLNDTIVPVENTLLYVSALRRHKIPFELHIFPEGDHGLSLCTEELLRTKSIFPRKYDWIGLSVDWITQLFKL